MTFEFLIACRMTPQTDIRRMLTELLAAVLVDNQNDFDEGIVADMVQLRHERFGDEVADNSGMITRHTLIGFALELPEDTVSIESLIEEFAKALPDNPPIFHIVKFEDPLLQAQLIERATEIFTLEMKLRRVLSLIYLHAYQDQNSFDLLRDETVQPTARERPQPDQMKAASENQFFHLTFSQYSNLNRRPVLNLSTMLNSIRTSADYDNFRAEILRIPIEREEDANLITGLKGLMEQIEQMRNCVAHNRRPSEGVMRNYPSARSQLEERLDEYLTQWETAVN